MKIGVANFFMSLYNGVLLFAILIRKNCYAKFVNNEFLFYQVIKNWLKVFFGFELVYVMVPDRHQMLTRNFYITLNDSFHLRSC